MSNEPFVFPTIFRALTDHAPLRWQSRLYRLLCDGNIPPVCDLPTGLGKTSVIPIWLIALASQEAKGRITLPRRLLYIVNRRTVVDQATDLVLSMRARINEAEMHQEGEGGPLVSIKQALKSISANGGSPFALTTLRGGLADNEEWKEDPARPAIIIGTIDMSGSKLLFSGYGDGRYKRAHHAGLIGKDTLVVHDEAHLTPAFSDLLNGVALEQERAKEVLPLRVLELSATVRAAGDGERFTLQPEDDQDTIVQIRLDARKDVKIHKVTEKAEVVESIVQSAFAHEHGRHKVIVYVTSPEEAQKVVDGLLRKLGKAQTQRVALLTGTLRGYERDKLVAENPVFRAMLGPDAVDTTVYLVSTSAGEVGIDLDADHMVTDLTTLDGLIQRLGRVNRRGGEGRLALVDVVAALPKEKKEKDSGEKEDEGKKANNAYGVALANTLALLEQWTQEPLNASPRNMGRLVQGLEDSVRNRAFAPKGDTKPLTDILLDGWSMTSITGPLPGRPEVAHYLHGVEAAPPETQVVWRSELDKLEQANLTDDHLGAWFQRCPPLVRERLRERSDRCKKKFNDLLEAHRKKDTAFDIAIVLLDERGNARWAKLSDTVEKFSTLLNYRTVILPTSAGGLNAHGALDAKEMDKASDVGDQIAEQDSGARRERWIATDGTEGTSWTRLTDGLRSNSAPKGLREKHRLTIKTSAEDAEDSVIKSLVLLVGSDASATDNPETASAEQTLADHLKSIEQHVTRIAHALRLDASLARCLVAAARCHDLGKARRVWQRYARNKEDGALPLAKSNKYGKPDELYGYRHEFGSLHDAAKDPHFMALEKDEQDLVLHLIAAHHGWGRPHFERRAWDREAQIKANEALATEVMQRFGRLQLKYGRWGLAWLESLLRCADIAASKEAVIKEVQLEHAEV